MTGKMEIRDVAKETIELLNYFDSKFISKISTKFLHFLEELAQSSTINVTIDKKKKLKDQNVSEECKSLISLIYYDYIANEEEKKKIEKIWSDNELVYQQKLRERYNPNDIFKKKRQNYEEIIEKEELQLIEYKKESFWSKLLNGIKSFFKEYGPRKK